MNTNKPSFELRIGHLRFVGWENSNNYGVPRYNIKVGVRVANDDPAVRTNIDVTQGLQEILLRILGIDADAHSKPKFLLRKQAAGE